MKIGEIMTRGVEIASPDDTIQQAAQLMRDHDCGCIPVVADKESNRLVGMITDRDIACRCVAEGKGPSTRVKEGMSPDPKSSRPDDDVETVERIMAGEQVRRVPVVDERGRCVGMIAQADLALDRRAASDTEVGEVVERISQPALTHH